MFFIVEVLLNIVDWSKIHRWGPFYTPANLFMCHRRLYEANEFKIQLFRCSPS
jgi:hypothetical protein